MNEEIILKKFAKRFSELIKNSSIDISKLAEMLGIKSKSTIYRYMNGEMTPKIPVVKYASEIFNVNPLWLMGYDVPMKIEQPSTSSNNLANTRFASYKGIDLEGLNETDIEEVNRFIETFIRPRKSKDKK